MATANLIRSYIQQDMLHVHAVIDGEASSPINGQPVTIEYVVRISVSEIPELTSLQLRARIVGAIRQQRQEHSGITLDPPALPATLTIPDN